MWNIFRGEDVAFIYCHKQEEKFRFVIYSFSSEFALNIPTLYRFRFHGNVWHSKQNDNPFLMI